MILKLCVFLQRGAHLAMGAEWEPSGAGTKTYVFCTPLMSQSYISLKECLQLAIGAEWEPSGADTRTQMYFVHSRYLNSIFSERFLKECVHLAMEAK